QPVAEGLYLTKRLLQVMRRNIGKILQLAVTALQFGSIAAQAFFVYFLLCNVMHKACVYFAVGQLYFAYAQVKRKYSTIPSEAGYFPADANNAFLSGNMVVVHVAVVQALVGLRHQHVNGLAQQVFGVITE